MAKHLKLTGLNVFFSHVLHKDPVTRGQIVKVEDDAEADNFLAMERTSENDGIPIPYFTEVEDPAEAEVVNEGEDGDGGDGDDSGGSTDDQDAEPAKTAKPAKAGTTRRKRA